MKKKLSISGVFVSLFSCISFLVGVFAYAQSEGCREGNYCSVSFVNDYGVIVGTANVMYGSVVNVDDVQLIENVKSIEGGYIFESGVTQFKFGETQIFKNLEVSEVFDVCKEGYYHASGSCVEYQYRGEIIHNIEDGTITLTYSGESIKILDRNLGAETRGYGLDAPENSYGDDFEFGGIFEREDTFTVYKGWPNNPCEEIGGYIPKYKDWIKLLKLRGQIRLSNEIAYLDRGAIQSHFDQIMADLLFPTFIFDNHYLSIDDLWSNEPADYEHSWVVAIEASTLDGFISEISDTRDKNKLRCFLPKDEEYLITFESMGKTVSEQKIPVREYNNSDGGYKVTSLTANKIEDPVMTGYEFLGWYVENENNEEVEYDFSEIVSSDLSLEAKWENLESKNKNNGNRLGSSGGGGRSSLNKNEEKTHNSADDKTNFTSGEKMKNNQNNIEYNNQKQIEENISETPERIKYSPDKAVGEMDQAYAFAHSYEITTKKSVKNAKMNSPLTRIQMAKMLSNYAINVLGKIPDISKGTIKFNDVTDKMDKSYDNGVTLAYQLGIMGQNVKDNKFRPNDEVTRAEFVTALSRLLYSTSDGEYKGTSKYYIHHMEKLVKEGIITRNDPKMKEKRGYAMIMLMRSATK